MDFRYIELLMLYTAYQRYYPPVGDVRVAKIDRINARIEVLEKELKL